MIPVEVRKIIVESRIKGISAEEIRKVTGVSISAIMWSKIKSLLRKWKARSSEVLNQFIEEAFSAVTTENIDHWFSACGYY